MSSNRSRQLPSVQQLDTIAQGQEQRTVLEGSSTTYISKCRVITRILNEIPIVRENALEFDEAGVPLQYSGVAKGVYRLKLPMTVETGRTLFAAISVDTTLPKKRRRGNYDENEEEGEMEDVQEEVVDLTEDALNPAKNKRTVCAQTYQNYKSALKWFHEHNDPLGKDKVGVAWPAELDRQINQQIKSYKRDIGIKKRNNVMATKKGNQLLT